MWRDGSTSLAAMRGHGPSHRRRAVPGELTGRERSASAAASRWRPIGNYGRGLVPGIMEYGRGLVPGIMEYGRGACTNAMFGGQVVASPCTTSPRRYDAAHLYPFPRPRSRRSGDLLGGRGADAAATGTRPEGWRRVLGRLRRRGR
jgi:hypothetical protein